MSKLEIESDDDWIYFKHGKEVYKISFYEFGNISDFERVKKENQGGCSGWP